MFKPITRREIFMKALAKGEVPNIEPKTREEMLLKEQCQREAQGGGSGGGSGNNVSINIPQYPETENRGGINYIVGATCNKTFAEIVDMICNYNLGAVTVNKIDAEVGAVRSYTTAVDYGSFDMYTSDHGSCSINEPEKAAYITVNCGNGSDYSNFNLYIWPDGISDNNGSSGPV